MVRIMEESKMTPEQFCYWLQGYMEMSEAEKLDEKQVKIMKDHLALVFMKVTPDYTTTTTSSDITTWPTNPPGLGGMVVC